MDMEMAEEIVGRIVDGDSDGDALELLQVLSDARTLELLLPRCSGRRLRMVEDRIAEIRRSCPVVYRVLSSEERRLPISITPEEAHEVAREATGRRVKHAAELERLKGLAKIEREAAAEQQGIADLATLQLRRMGLVDVEAQLRGELVAYVRMDTGVVISSRPATHDEIQEPIPF